MTHFCVTIVFFFISQLFHAHPEIFHSKLLARTSENPGLPQPFFAPVSSRNTECSRIHAARAQHTYLLTIGSLPPPEPKSRENVSIIRHHMFDT